MLRQLQATMGRSGPVVSPSAHNIQNARVAADCQANFKVDNDGDEYESDNVGGYGASSGTWLDSGLNSEVWVERTVNSGTLDTDTIGASRVSCTGDQIVGITRTTIGTDNADVDIDYYDAASGGTLIGTQNILLQAERTA
jgi:hypothetical protein